MHLLSLNYALIYILNKGHYLVFEKKCKLLLIWHQNSDSYESITAEEE